MPGAGRFDEVGFFGVQPEPEFEREGPIGALGTGAALTWDVTKLSFRGIGEVFTMVFGGELWDALQGQGEREIDEGPLGLVGAGRIASETVERGRFLDFIGLIVGFLIMGGQGLAALCFTVIVATMLWPKEPTTSWLKPMLTT